MWLVLELFGCQPQSSCHQLERVLNHCGSAHMYLCVVSMSVCYWQNLMCWASDSVHATFNESTGQPKWGAIVYHMMIYKHGCNVCNNSHQQGGYVRAHVKINTYIIVHCGVQVCGKKKASFFLSDSSMCMHCGNCHVVMELSASETTGGQYLVIKDFTKRDGHMLQDRGW